MAREEEHSAGWKGRAGCPTVETAAAVGSSSSQSSAAAEENRGTAEPATASDGVDRPEPPSGRSR